MAITDEKDEQQTDAEEGVGEASSEAGAETEALATTSEESLATEGDEGEDDDDGAHTLGSERYVHAAFFVAGILAAYIASKTLVLAWNSLANWPAAVRAVPA